MTSKSLTLAIAAAALWPHAGAAENLVTRQTDAYGMPGSLIEMPTAENAPDAQLSTSVVRFEDFARTTLTFQALPRLSGSFRYSATDGLSPNFDTYYDRSFDLKFRLLDETRMLPAVSVGMRDFIGTGIQSAEYLVATKSFGDRLRLTGGLGWGRLGSANPIGQTGDRPALSSNFQGEGGDLNSDEWFRGDVALFGGVSYQATDKLSLSAEYSSDAYRFEQQQGVFKPSSRWNFAADYAINRDIRLGLFSLYGEKFGAKLTLSFNPKEAPAPGGLEESPLPVALRAPADIADLGWTTDPEAAPLVQDGIRKTLDLTDIDLEGLTVEGRSAHVSIRNSVYDIRAQALGRTLRALSRSLPSSVETIHVTLTQLGIPLSTVTVQRSDLERLEHAPAAAMLARTQFSDSLRFGNLPAPLPGEAQKFSWSLAPYLQLSFFDPDQPLRADAGLRLNSSYEFGRGLILSGAVSAKLIGNIDKSDRVPNSRLPHVRTSSAQYFATDNPVINRLTLADYSRPAPDLYTRLTVGYLENMYAGASGEVLWKPVDSRLALGAELNFVRPRDFDRLFGIRSRQTPGGEIPEFNGHLSAYYDLGFGFHGQIDAGRYLAGDWGATLSVDREFANGWRVGAFVTRTDVSAEEFGEGSFDKGIRITAPISWLTGQPTQQTSAFTISPLNRDGGSRLRVEGRLYDTVRGAHQPEIAKSWGKFWK